LWKKVVQMQQGEGPNQDSGHTRKNRESSLINTGPLTIVFLDQNS
jgi:hypothetical protein